MLQLKIFTVLVIVIGISSAAYLEDRRSRKGCWSKGRLPLIKKDVDINTSSEVHIFLLPHKGSCKVKCGKTHVCGPDGNTIQKESIEHDADSNGDSRFGFGHLGKLGELITDEIVYTDASEEECDKHIRYRDRHPRRHYRKL